jgi:SagB-type dehydrogenase family enzyme
MPTSDANILSAVSERETFRNKRLGLRRFPETSSLVPLASPHDENLLQWTRRTNSRQMSPGAISSYEFGAFLSCLRARKLPERWKYRYASAGGLYPVQVYVWIHKRMPLAQGTYYYDPSVHALRGIEPGAQLPAEAHEIINRPVFPQAAFSLFLVCEQNAIVPIYGDESARFSLLEAGMMSQLLDQSAISCGIGLCHIGVIDFDLCFPSLHLNSSHTLLHVYLGGKIHSSDEPHGIRKDSIGADLKVREEDGLVIASKGNLSS